MPAHSLLRRAGVFAVAVAGLGFATPALASDAGNATVRHVASARGGFAGYSGPLEDYGSPSFITATTTFRVPKLRCGSADQAIAPAVGSEVGPNVGVPRIWEASLFVGCHGGKAHYWPELEVRGNVKNYPTRAAHAGDTIILWLDTKSGHVSVADKTHKFKVSRTDRPRSRTTNVEEAWIGDAGWTKSHGRVERVPDFGTLTYSNTTISREPFDHWFLGKVNQSSGKTLQIATGLPFGGGKAFRTDFKHS